MPIVPPPTLEKVTYPDSTSDSDQTIDNESEVCAQDDEGEVDMHLVDYGDIECWRSICTEVVCRVNSEVPGSSGL
jgi:hypothetical protein